jgi:hypothetical protein
VSSQITGGVCVRCHLHVVGKQSAGGESRMTADGDLARRREEKREEERMPDRAGKPM